MKSYYVYILTNRHNGALYIGVTNDIRRRIAEHGERIEKSHTAKYVITTLVYYEETTDVQAALAREKQLKNWKREWKISLIESVNPEWHDLSSDLR